jgi:hypothetical protein
MMAAQLRGIKQRVEAAALRQPPVKLSLQQFEKPAQNLN